MAHSIHHRHEETVVTNNFVLELNEEEFLDLYAMVGTSSSGPTGSAIFEAIDNAARAAGIQHAGHAKCDQFRREIRERVTRAQ
jgi:hypothetical protein